MSQREGHLEKRLGLPSVVAFGLAYMAPSLVMVIFGVIAVASAGTAPTAFLIATLAMLLTAISYSKLSKHYPVSGSAYFYARRLLNSPIGFLVGWSILLDYLFLPMVAWLVQSVYLNAQFPEIPVWAWMLINAGLTTAINIIGLVLSDRVNMVLTAFSVFLVLLFVAYCLVFLVHHPAHDYITPVWNSQTSLGGVTAAAAIAAYSYLGFDAVTTLSEETKDASKTIPRAVILVIVIGGLLFVSVAYVMQLVHPGFNFGGPGDEQVGGYILSIQVGGQTFADWTNLAGVVAGFASGLAVQLSSSRLLYFMGRDGVLSKRLFGWVSPVTKTPIWAIAFTGLMCVVGMFLTTDIAYSFINFGAFTGFTVVNICVIAFYVRKRKTTPLGVVGYVILPAVGACVTLYMLTRLSPTALIIGSTWLAAGFLWLLWLTRGFRRPTPAMSVDEAGGEIEDIRTRPVRAVELE
ncbi:APC family permease [Leifsonia sp. 21MFCrub1.1]|uniref:APC family permease n=1 Tax=Leifsonia sp. 21MFCrub1.1 TaxID=1798223 RepID=UPI0008928B0F|nr:APC family permease [Leifsonia sp. 21MFCrub1.1]SEB09453.1 Amino acid transporter [Leifsonia sp. 21MFCrub1.1]